MRLRPVRQALWAGAAFQTLVALWFGMHWDPAIARLWPDDAFYYQQIARHLARGEGSVFSAGEPTNGYHPLWMALLTLVQTLPLPPGGTIALTLLLSAACNAAGAGQMARLVEPAGGERAAVWAVLIYLLSPWMVCLSLTGLETPLLWLCLGWWLNAAGAAWTTPPSLRSALLLGVAAGTLMLARMDAVFFTAIGFVALALRHGRRGLPALTLSVLAAALLLAPWLLWNLSVFQTIVPSSSYAMADLVHAGWSRYGEALRQGGAGILRFALEKPVWLAYRLLWTPFVRVTPAELSAAPWAVAAAGAATLAGIGAALGRGGRGRGPAAPALGLFPALLLSLFYLYVRWFWQVWHHAPLLYIGVLFGALRAGAGHADPRRSGPICAAALTGATLLALRTAYFWPQEATGLLARAQRFHDDAPGRLTIGVTDSGYVGYFSRHHVVNLDGVVNHRAAQAIRRGRLQEYLRSRRFDLVEIDRDRLFYYNRAMEQER